MNNLKPYQVGDNDIVLAMNEENAKQVFFDYCGEQLDPIDEMEVDDLSNRLEMKLVDEDGKLIDTLGDYINGLDEPQYLLGWE